METKKKSNILHAFLIGLIAAVVTLILNSVLTSFILIRSVVSGIVFNTIIGAIVFVLAGVIYCLAIAKKKMNVGALVLAAILTGLIKAIVTQVITNFIFRYLIMIFIEMQLPVNVLIIAFGFVLNVIFYFLGMAVFLSFCKEKPAFDYTAFSSTYTPSNGVAYNPGSETASSSTNQTGTSEINDDLMDKILMAVKPYLKAPITAVLCGKEEMTFIPDGKGGYDITGYVNSQNSYGAMVRTGFKVNAVNMSGTWQILSAKVGVREAMEAGKNFAAAWIIGIIVTLVTMAFFYFIISNSLF